MVLWTVDIFFAGLTLVFRCTRATFHVRVKTLIAFIQRSARNDVK